MRAPQFLRWRSPMPSFLFLVAACFCNLLCPVGASWWPCLCRGESRRLQASVTTSMLCHLLMRSACSVCLFFVAICCRCYAVLGRGSILYYGFEALLPLGRCVFVLCCAAKAVVVSLFLGLRCSPANWQWKITSVQSENCMQKFALSLGAWI